MRVATLFVSAIAPKLKLGTVPRAGGLRRAKMATERVNSETIGARRAVVRGSTLERGSNSLATRSPSPLSRTNLVFRFSFPFGNFSARCIRERRSTPTRQRSRTSRPAVPPPTRPASPTFRSAEPACGRRKVSLVCSFL